MNLFMRPSRAVAMGLWMVVVAVMSAGPGRAGECFMIEQAVGGIPGQEEGETITQRLYIMKDKLRLDEGVPGSDEFVSRCLLLGTKNSFHVYEFLHKTKTYKVWQELQNIQADRELFERQILGVVPEAQWPAYHLRPGLEREVLLTQDPGKALQVGGQEYACQHVVVAENGLAIVDAQVATTLAYGLDYYTFYRKVGVFSDEVLAKLKAIKGFPLKATIRVVTRKPKWHTLTIQVKQAVKVQKPDAFFELPKGWTRDEKPPVKDCFYRGCQNKVETANPVGGKFRYQGRWEYFCCDECRKQFKREYTKRLREIGKKAGGQ